jgi:methyl-accepting chemotaxis protein
MPGEHEEIGTKLTMDDEASETLKKVSEGFEKVGERVHETAHEMLGMAKQAAAFALGFQLNSIIDSVKDFSEEIVHAAMGLEEENKGLAGVISMTEKGEYAFIELANDAAELNDRLETLGITTGNAKDAMIDAFEMIAEKSTKGADHVEDMVNEMAQAAKSLPGGISTLSAAWRDLESGIVRPRNALVQLMRQMHVVNGTAKTVAKGLSAMVQAGKQDKVFELAEEAVNRMAKRTKDMPLTFSQMLQGLGTFRESLFETAGTPVIKALRAQFETLQTYLTGHREEIERLAQALGERVGRWVNAAAEKIQVGFNYLQTHASEIMHALETGGAALMKAVQFVVDHKDLLLALAVANVVGSRLPSGAQIAGAGLAAGRAVGAVGRGIGIAGSLANGALQVMPGTGVAAAGGAGSAAVAAAPAVALGMATTAAVAAWYVAALEADKLSKETGMTLGEMAHSIAHLDLANASNRLADFDAKVRRFDEDAKKADTSTEALSRLAHGMEHIERAGEIAGDSVDK